MRRGRDGGAEGGIRTRTGFPTRPSNVRVYQVPPLRQGWSIVMALMGCQLHCDVLYPQV